MKKIDTLVQDVYAVMKSKEYTGDLKGIAKQVGDEVAEALVQAFEPYEDKRTLRMSGIGRCERSQWYNIKGYKAEEIDGSIYLTFLQGHILEAVLLAIVKLSGHTVTGQQKKHTVEDINGSQDCEIDGELVDVKTASDWSWKNKFKEYGVDGDTFGYIKQLSAYGKTAGRKVGYFLAFNKNKSTLKLCKQELDTDVDTYIVDLKAKMQLDTPPMRIAGATVIDKGKAKLCMQCAFCGYKEHCYGALEEKTYASGMKVYYAGTMGGDF
jgi:hypothetical protein